MFNLQKTASPYLRRLHFYTLAVILLKVGGCLAIYSQSTQASVPPGLKICQFYESRQSVINQIASDNASSLYFTNLNGNITSLNPDSSEKHWETELGGAQISEPKADDLHIYLATRNLNAESSTERTAVERNAEKIETAGRNVLSLRALDKLTGITRWQTELRGEEFSFAESAYLDAVSDRLIFVSEMGVIYLFAKDNGQIVWKKSLDTAMTAPPLIADKKIYLGTDNSKILALSLENGQVVETFDVSAPATFLIRGADANKLIVGDRKGTVILIDEKRKSQNAKFRGGGAISSLTRTPEGLLVASLDNFIYLLSETRSKVIWKKRLSGRISSEPLVKNNLVVMASTESSEAVALDLRSGRIFDRVTLEKDNFFSGRSLQIGNLFVYATLRGVISFSLAEAECRSF